MKPVKVTFPFILPVYATVSPTVSPIATACGYILVLTSASPCALNKLLAYNYPWAILLLLFISLIIFIAGTLVTASWAMDAAKLAPGNPTGTMITEFGVGL